MARIIRKTVKVNLTQNEMIDQIGRDFKSSKHNEIIVRLIEGYPRTKRQLQNQEATIADLQAKADYYENLIQRYRTIIREMKAFGEEE